MKKIIPKISLLKNKKWWIQEGISDKIFLRKARGKR